MRVAGIVLYNPDVLRLKENINAIETQVDYIVCIDNASKNLKEIKELLKNNKKVLLFENNSNLGVAKALNMILVKAKTLGAEWVLTLDQDSVVFSDLIETYEQYVKIKEVGIISCIIQDRNSDIKVEFNEDYIEIEDCITSGSYCNIDACLEAGGFDEAMFIDYVDFDICKNLQESGYRIIRINFEGLLHEVGKIKIVNFLGKREEIYNHPPFRKYYIVRNRIYYARKHRCALNEYREYLKVIKYMLLVEMYEKEKIKKMCMMLKGLKDGIVMARAINSKKSI